MKRITPKQFDVTNFQQDFPPVLFVVALPILAIVVEVDDLAVIVLRVVSGLKI